MPMKMGIHRQPIARGYSAFLDSRMHGNDGGMFFLRKHLTLYPLALPSALCPLPSSTFYPLPPATKIVYSEGWEKLPWLAHCPESLVRFI